MITIKDTKYLTVQEVADLLGKSARTINLWAAKGEGPPRGRLPGDTAGTLFYPEEALIEWMESRVGQTSQEGA